MKQPKTEKKVIESKVKVLISVLKFFDEIKEPIYEPTDCPFSKDDHYCLSEAAGGLGRWRWNCPLCGEHFEE